MLRKLSAITCLLVLGLSLQVLPIASAAAPPAVTRAQFCADLVGVLGLPPYYPLTPDFTDVPVTNPDYTAIETAYHAGIISGVRVGVFNPNGPLTRAEIAKMEVLALGDGSAAQALANTQTTFRDNGAIPSWARGYINEAVKLGLISGYPDGTFRPGQDLTALDAAAFLRKLSNIDAVGAYSVTVTPSSALVAVGQQVSLSGQAKSRNGVVVWGAGITFSTANRGAVVSGNSFVGSAPGSYTVTGTYENGGHAYTGTTTITVAGPPASLRIEAPSYVLANGTQQTVVKVDVIDAQGNIALGDTGSNIDLSISGGAFATNGTPLTVADVGGVATFTLTDGSVSGVTSTLVAGDAALPATVTAQATVQGVAQVPASISLTGPSEIPANISGNLVTVQARVEDATGQALLRGDIPLTVTLTGPAAFPGGGQGPETLYYNGNGQTGVGSAYVAIPVESVQGETGTITVQVSTGGVPTQTATIDAVIAGVPNALTVTGPTAGTVTRDMTAQGVTFGISATDGEGLPATTVPSPLLVTVRTSSGAVAQGWTVDGQAPGQNGAVEDWAVSQGHFTVTDQTPGGDLGTYTVTVSDPSGAFKSSAPLAFTVTAGAAAGVAAHLASTGLWVQNPTTTLTVQVVDAHGNPVALAGVPVTVTSAQGNVYPVAFSLAQGTTNAQGAFTTTVQAQGKVGPIETVDVSATVAGKTVSAFPQPQFVVQPWGP